MRGPAAIALSARLMTSQSLQTCHEELKIIFYWRFVWATERLLSGASLHSCFEFVSLALTFCGFVMTYFMLLQKAFPFLAKPHDYSHDNP